jgi:mono/diheme cytochrome c family protein
MEEFRTNLPSRIKIKVWPICWDRHSHRDGNDQSRSGVVRRIFTMQGTVRPLRQLFLLSVFVSSLTAGLGASLQHETSPGKFYRVVDGKVDARTYNGYRLYQGSCSHCHGPDGLGSTFAASLVDRLPKVDAFRGIVSGGQTSGTSVMKGFANDPNIAPYIDDIYAYLQARADGVLGRGRPIKLEP